MKKPKISAAGEEPDWPAIRARYEARDEAVADIAISIGMKAHALTQHAKSQGWTMRCQRRASATIEVMPAPQLQLKPITST